MIAAARKAVEINPFDAEARIIFGSRLAILAELPDPEAGLKLIKEG